MKKVIEIVIGVIIGVLGTGISDYLRYKFSTIKNEKQLAEYNFLLFYYNPQYLDFINNRNIDHKEIERDLNRKKVYSSVMFVVTTFLLPIILKWAVFITLLLVCREKGVTVFEAILKPWTLNNHLSWDVFNFMKVYHSLNPNTVLSIGQAALYSSTITLIFIAPLGVGSHLMSRLTVFVIDKFYKTSFKSYFRYRIISYFIISLLCLAIVVKMTTTLSYIASLGSILLILIFAFMIASSQEQ